MAPVIYSIVDWLQTNKKFFEPPICNKLMYEDGQIKCFFVGGPNSRKDFHIEEGEEFFYMLKGDMNLVVVEQGKFRDIIIREGQVFLLPGRIPHSPQRFESTYGMVIERERQPHEMDGMRYYVENSTEILYEKWFHCDSLDSQLPPLIQDYFKSEQYRTGKPVEGSVLKKKPIDQDFTTLLNPPVDLKSWIRENKDELNSNCKKALFSGSYASKITVLGAGIYCEDAISSETFLWQLEGSALLINDDREYELRKNYTALLKKEDRWQLQNKEDAYTLQVIMNPVN